MAFHESQTPHVGGQTIVKPIVRTAKATARGLCLIVSADARRRRMLQRAAADGGWATVVCAEARRAGEEAARLAFAFALVDVQSAGDDERIECQRLVERLTAEAGPLVAACCADGAPSDEIWARKAGVWAYLPGVGPTDDLATVCAEARLAAQKLDQRLPAGAVAQ
jgi:ActR/RegA family two-component response regulator